MHATTTLALWSTRQRGAMCCRDRRVLTDLAFRRFRRASNEPIRPLVNATREVRVPQDPHHADLFRALAICLHVLAAPLPHDESDGGQMPGAGTTGTSMRQVLALAQRVASVDS